MESRQSTVASVYIAAAAQLYREGLTLGLRDAHSLRVVESAPGPFEFVTGPTDRRAVLLLDAAVAVTTGPQTLEGVLRAYPDVRVVMLGLSEVTTEILGWIEAGASGFVTLHHSIADLVAVIDCVVRDEFSCSPRPGR